MRGGGAAFALALAALLACARGPLPAAGAPAAYLRATDGAQCGLDAEARSRTAAAARVRAEGEGARVEAAWVATRLSGLPEACRPAGGHAGLEELFRGYPAAVADAESFGRMTCQACGCPQTWLVCLRAAGPPEALVRAGFAPAGAVSD